jgi:hypothetical protein
MLLQGLGFMPLSWAQTELQREYEATRLFRKQFARYAEAGYTPEQIQQLIFPPHRTLLERSTGGHASVEDVLDFHRSRLQSILPSQLFEDARQTSHNPFPRTLLMKTLGDYLGAQD